MGFTAGFGEFIGYGLRLITGYFADRTTRYWLFTGLGYSINLLAIPALALGSDFRIGFAILLLPALLALATLLVAKINFPQPRELEEIVKDKNPDSEKFAYK